ncbi:MAG: peptidoglycan recognition family protein [Planctomycetota bacterium]|nr:peptidoglycan recognition family protein [Planctomycetota bacterium]
MPSVILETILGVVMVRRMQGARRFATVAREAPAMAAAAGLVAWACAAPRTPPPVGWGESIVVCGRAVEIGVPVVTWTDPGGYDATATAYDPARPPEHADLDSGRRYSPGRRRDGRVLVPPGSGDRDLLASVVDQFVVHYDVCGTSRTCFDVLHRRRGLSVHFLLDLDGTIYQTLDVRDTAWHAGPANARSIGIEIAQWGARAPSRAGELDEWYASRDGGTRITIPERFGDGGLRTSDFEGWTARPSLQRGRIHGAELVQFDFTVEQYDSLVRLLAALCSELPRLLPSAPRDEAGRVRTGALTAEELDAFRGILGHHHVTARKVDPGPAFDWERVLRGVRERLELGQK